MARAVKEDENAAKRNQILDVTERLIYTKGYESMTIQDVLNGIQMSKGAFYHYFDSKQSLLRALIDRMMNEVEKMVAGIANDPGLTALEKLHRYFNDTAIWKTERKSLMYSIMRVWYSDENTLVRQRLIDSAIARLGPYFSQIVNQGLREGTMHTRFPDDIAGMVYSVFQIMGESLVRLLLAPEPMADRQERMAHTFAFYTDTMERLLGTQAGTLRLVDSDLLNQWLIAPEAEPGPAEALAVS